MRREPHGSSVPAPHWGRTVGARTNLVTLESVCSREGVLVQLAITQHHLLKQSPFGAQHLDLGLSVNSATDAKPSGE